MSGSVLIQTPILAEAEEYITAHGCTILRGSGTSREALLEDIRDCDAVVAKKAANYTFDRQVIDSAPRLKLIARFGVGLEIIDVEYAQSQGVIVTNSPRANGNAVAEHAVYLMLACAKNGLKLDRRIRSGAFSSGAPEFSTELKGAVLGIVGCGNIGSLVAHKAKHGFDMKVIGFDPHRPPDQFPPDIERRESLESVLQESDFISLHLPALPETVGLLSMEKLRLMKRSACLINTSRGEVVDEAALCTALEQGVIAGAGLDVYEKEPLPMDSPLLRLQNVVLTPHYAAFTKEALRTTAMDVAKDIVAVLNGEPPKWEVTHLGISPRINKEEL